MPIFDHQLQIGVLGGKFMAHELWQLVDVRSYHEPVGAPRRKLIAFCNSACFARFHTKR